MKNYNVKHPLQNDVIALKAQTTTLKHHGVKYPLLSHDIRAKAKQKYEYDGICFDSKPELAMYIFLKDREVEFTYLPNVHFTYICNGILYLYFPDFIVNGLLVEIKGKHFFKEDGTMCNPWDHNQDKIYEAKHLCMVANNVKILLDDSCEVKEAVEYVAELYEKAYLDKFKRKNTIN